jgi:3-hydroxyisobutyrate dehydrogenase-like beta-hydroxyacid dehydrogenase
MSSGMTGSDAIGFIGLGVMGEPICRNLLRKSGRPVVAFDLAAGPLARLRAEGAATAASVAEVMQPSDLVFCCLPSGKHLHGLFAGEGGVLANARQGQVVVDLGTSPVALTRELAKLLEAKGARFADAPIARTREAAINGTLSVMVGASADLFARLEPVIRHFATEVTNCGDIGAGQVTKILNNMVLFQTVNALSEAAAIARRSGVEPKLLFETLSRGSADSFALRNHGLKAVIPNEFPERAFSTEYALKDLSYALDLARDAGIVAPGAELAGSILQEAIDRGHGAAYWPIIARVVDKR